jgi:hypothetical protein
MDHHSQISPGDFYTDTVLPALADQLDQVFPEFGWRRDNRGWVATNQDTTHSLLGVRADRVVAHGHAPQGFLVHGAQPVLWTTYINNGTTPRGAEFIRAVREIALRAGVDPTPLERPVQRDRRADLLNDFFALCRQELTGVRGGIGRAYLQRRGLPAETIEHSGLGIVPKPTLTRTTLQAAGYTESEIAGSNVLADSRWPGRLCGAWRDHAGRARTLWARTLDHDASPDSRYLYLRGASRTNLPPYGLSDALAGPGDTRHDLVLVEGVFDVHQLRTRGIQNIAALGGTSVRTETFERLARLGVERATLFLDNDEAGLVATARAVECAARAHHSPTVLVVDPERLVAAKDPDELLRAKGTEAWQAVVRTRECGVGWRALQFTREINRTTPQEVRRTALQHAGNWLGSLPPRLALEQDDAVRALARRCGYSIPAVERAFRARYWNAADRQLGASRLRIDESTIGLSR